MLRDRRGGSELVGRLIIIGLIAFVGLLGVRAVGSKMKQKLERQAHTIAADFTGGEGNVGTIGGATRAEPTTTPAEPTRTPAEPTTTRAEANQVVSGLVHVVSGALSILSGAGLVVGAAAGEGLSAGLGTPAAIFVGAVGMTMAGAGASEATAGAAMVINHLLGREPNPAHERQAGIAGEVALDVGLPFLAYDVYRIGKALGGLFGRGGASGSVKGGDGAGAGAAGRAGAGASIAARNAGVSNYDVPVASELSRLAEGKPTLLEAAEARYQRFGDTPDENWNPKKVVEFENRLAAASLRAHDVYSAELQMAVTGVFNYMKAKQALGIATVDEQLLLTGKHMFGFGAEGRESNQVFYGRLAETGPINVDELKKLQYGGRVEQVMYFLHSFADQVLARDYMTLTGEQLGEIHRIAGTQLVVPKSLRWNATSEVGGTRIDQPGGVFGEVPETVKGEGAASNEDKLISVVQKGDDGLTLRGRVGPGPPCPPGMQGPCTVTRFGSLEDAKGKQVPPLTAEWSGIATRPGQGTPGMTRDQLQPPPPLGVGAEERVVLFPGSSRSDIPASVGDTITGSRGLELQTLYGTNKYIQQMLLFGRPVAGGISGTSADFFEIATMVKMTPEQSRRFGVAVLGQLEGAGGHSFGEIAAGGQKAVPNTFGDYRSYFPPEFLDRPEVRQIFEDPRFSDIPGIGKPFSSMTGAPTPQCFAAGTLVDTTRGMIAIEKIHAGDFVLSRDAETRTVSYAAVQRTYTTPDSVVEELHLSSATGEETLRVTPDHPFHVEGRGWVAAHALGASDRISSLDGSSLSHTFARSLPGTTTVYNLEVAHSHTYFVGRSHAWVHNQCGPPTGYLYRGVPANHPDLASAQQGTVAGKSTKGTSWSADLETAKAAAQKAGPGGVILRAPAKGGGFGASWSWVPPRQGGALVVMRGHRDGLQVLDAEGSPRATVPATTKPTRSEALPATTTAGPPAPAPASTTSSSMAAGTVRVVSSTTADGGWELSNKGPIGCYSACGDFGAVGRHPWNPSQYISGDFQVDWSPWSATMTKDAGPLSEHGILVNNPYAYEGRLPAILRVDGSRSVLGPRGVYGPEGYLGPLGPAGAHGFGTNSAGDYVHNGEIVRTIETPNGDGTSSKHELFEHYTLERATSMKDNDTSFMVDATIEPSESHQFTITAETERYVNILLTPAREIDSFVLTVSDQAGRTVWTSTLPSGPQWATLEVGPDTTLTVHVRPQPADFVTSAVQSFQSPKYWLRVTPSRIGNAPPGSPPIAIFTKPGEITFRGDRRSPAEVFETGFRARGTNLDKEAHVRSDPKGEESGYVSTSRDEDMAATFTRHPLFDEPGQWIYRIRVRDEAAPVDIGHIMVSDIHGVSDVRVTEKEIAVPGSIPPEDIISATEVAGWNGRTWVRGRTIFNPKFKP